MVEFGAWGFWSKYTAVLLALLGLIALSLAQNPQAPNSTIFPSNSYGGKPVAQNHSAAAAAAIAGGTNAVAVFFTNGQAQYVQNVPQPGFNGQPGDAAPQLTNCYDGAVTPPEVCDYKLNPCCDVNQLCKAYKPVNSACEANDLPGQTNFINKTIANKVCTKDFCNSLNVCTRSIAAANTTKTVTNNPKKHKKKGVKTFTTVTGTVCFPPASTTTRQLEVRNRKGRRRNGKSTVKKGKKPSTTSAITPVYCNGSGVCPCTNCAAV